MQNILSGGGNLKTVIENANAERLAGKGPKVKIKKTRKGKGQKVSHEYVGDNKASGPIEPTDTFVSKTRITGISKEKVDGMRKGWNVSPAVAAEHVLADEMDGVVTGSAKGKRKAPYEYASPSQIATGEHPTPLGKKLNIKGIETARRRQTAVGAKDGVGIDSGSYSQDVLFEEGKGKYVSGETKWKDNISQPLKTVKGKLVAQAPDIKEFFGATVGKHMRDSFARGAYNIERRFKEALVGPTDAKVNFGTAVLGMKETGLKSLPKTAGDIAKARAAHLAKDGRKKKGRAAGHVPNFAKLAGSVQRKKRAPLKVSSTITEPMGGGEKQVTFRSSVGKKDFSTARAKTVPDPKGEGTALQMQFLSQSPRDLRGKGYGKDLYNHIFNYAKKSGHSALLGDGQTSLKAMHVVRSISKGRKYQEAPGLETAEGSTDLTNYGDTDWTYRMASAGFTPNFEANLDNVKEAMAREEAMGGKAKVLYSHRLQSPVVVSKKQIEEHGKNADKIIRKDHVNRGQGGSKSNLMKSGSGKEMYSDGHVPNFFFDAMGIGALAYMGQMDSLNKMMNPLAKSMEKASQKTAKWAGLVDQTTQKISQNQQALNNNGDELDKLNDLKFDDLGTNLKRDIKKAIPKQAGDDAEGRAQFGRVKAQRKTELEDDSKDREKDTKKQEKSLPRREARLADVSKDEVDIQAKSEKIEGKSYLGNS